LIGPPPTLSGISRALAVSRDLGALGANSGAPGSAEFDHLILPVIRAFW